MATARDFVTRALRLLRVIGAGDAPTADEATDALATFNEMLAAWQIDGLDLGLPVLALGDEVLVPAPYEMALRYNLAVKLASEFGAGLTPEIVGVAEAQERVIRAWQADVDELTVDPMLVRRGTYYRGGAF